MTPKKNVVVLSLASDFGCQVQMTNFPQLLEQLSSFNLVYWQLATKAPHASEYEVAIIEGAVTTDEHVELLKKVREQARIVIAIGACACTAGIPGLVNTRDLEESGQVVYGDDFKLIAPGHRSPAPVKDIIDVDFSVPGCPIEPLELSRTLQRALLELNDTPHLETLCAECKMNENPCFYKSGTACLGLVTRGGCNTLCVNRGRACAGCRGIAPDANIDAAREFARKFQLEDAFNEALDLYNATRKDA